MKDRLLGHPWPRSLHQKKTRSRRSRSNKRTKAGKFDKSLKDIRARALYLCGDRQKLPKELGKICRMTCAKARIAYFERGAASRNGIGMSEAHFDAGPVELLALPRDQPNGKSGRP